jgi:tagatose-6-phosphate ketose/aldose isomerase
VFEQQYGRNKSFFKQHCALITAEEILQQPVLWRELAVLLINQNGEINQFIKKLSPMDHLRIVLTGAGSSAFIGESLQAMLQRFAGIKTEAVATTDIVSAPEAFLMDLPTLMVSFSRSGESAESMEAIRLANKHIKKLFHLVAVCKKLSTLETLAKKTSETLVLDLPEKSSDLGFAMTSSISCMILATYAALTKIDVNDFASYINKLSDSVEGEFKSINELAQKIAAFDYSRIVYLGSGGLKGLAHEGAIKSLELTNGKVNASFETPMGFRHGPKAVLNDTTLTVHFISPMHKTQQYDIDLLNEVVLQKHGNRQVAIVPKDCTLSCKPDYVFAYEMLGQENIELTAYIKGLIFLQLLSLEKSILSGTPTDNPSPKGEINRVVQGVVIH